MLPLSSTSTSRAVTSPVHDGEAFHLLLVVTVFANYILAIIIATAIELSLASWLAYVYVRDIFEINTVARRAVRVCSSRF